MTDPALATSVSNLRSVSSKNARNVLNSFARYMKSDKQMVVGRSRSRWRRNQLKETAFPCEGMEARSNDKGKIPFSTKQVIEYNMT